MIFTHHRWANLTIIDFCATLTGDQLALAGPGVFGSTLDTIRHLVANEAHYLTFLDGCDTVEVISQKGPFTGWTPVRSVAAASGDALIRYVSTLQGDPIQRGEYCGEAYEKRSSLFLTQIIDHATEHRSQIRTALSSHGIVPPEVDGWAWEEATSGR
jgi:uncharacterized damage-inducible protein DinB